ncbi:MAG: heme oxygenase [Flavobacteriales bacterium 32-34-25]|nr:MAG: heme oxygenase [Flavobacteriales bacterium 32-34-25]
MNIQHINNSIEAQKSVLLQHSLYNKVKTIEDLHTFLESHVYAVWDFMSLLKALQSRLTCTTTPWFATQNPETRYLINEIVLAEETDLTLDGRRQSHFEMYLEAMEDCGADISKINSFLSEIQSLQNIFVAIKKSDLHPNIKAFLDFTFRVIEEGKPHEIAAAFTFGREDLIPSMFHAILKNFQEQFPETDLSKLIYYFERHIELDADEHGPMAMQMINELCGEDPQKWNEVEEVSILALEKRIELWNAIEEIIIMKVEMA